MSNPRFLTVLALLFCLVLTPLLAWAAPGGLDPSFGADGKVTTPFGSGNDIGAAVAVQSDGKIVVAGYSYNDSNNTDFALARYETTLPEMAVLGNGAEIAAGDASPASADDTDFGNVTLGVAFTRIFTISNSGGAVLNLTGTPVVSITGPRSRFQRYSSNRTPRLTRRDKPPPECALPPPVTGTRAATVTIAQATTPTRILRICRARARGPTRPQRQRGQRPERERGRNGPHSTAVAAATRMGILP